MTREALTKLAKDYKINLDHFSHIYAYENDTQIVCIFGEMQVLAGKRRLLNEKIVRKNKKVAYKNAKYNNVWPWDYITDGYESINQITGRYC